MSASDSSRVALEVSTTIGRRVAVIVPSSGMVTWKSRQHLQQQPLDLDVGLVGLVDEQHGRVGAPDGGQQRPGEQELLAEDVVVDGVPVGAAGALRRLDPQQLLLVVPLVQRPRLVEPLVALQPDQLGRRSPSPAPWPARSCRRPAGPSTSSGLPSRSARNTVVAICASGRYPAVEQPLGDVGDRGELRDCAAAGVRHPLGGGRVAQRMWPAPVTT